MSRKRTANTEHAVVSDHPVRAASEASRHFLNGAATPPHEEGIALASDSMCKAPGGRRTRPPTFPLTWTAVPGPRKGQPQPATPSCFADNLDRSSDVSRLPAF